VEYLIFNQTYNKVIPLARVGFVAGGIPGAHKGQNFAKAGLMAPIGGPAPRGQQLQQRGRLGKLSVGVYFIP
jgi:hypothetical protein